MNIPLETCIESALAGGRAAFHCPPSKAEVKSDDLMGNHAIVSQADFASQAAILNEIYSRDPQAIILNEEVISDKRFNNKKINSSNLETLKYSRTYVIDELDGSSSHNAGHYEWNVSIGYMENLKPIAGAIFAPCLFGGLLVYSSPKGVFEINNALSKPEEKEVKVIEREIKDSYIIFGTDTACKDKYPKHYQLIGDLSDKVRTTNMNGSCALPLALIASGRVDALIQSLQSPWDYTAGAPMVKRAGGEVIFYEMDEQGACLPIQELELKHYNPDKKNVGFIAGNRTITPYIANMLF